MCFMYWTSIVLVVETFATRFFVFYVSKLLSVHTPAFFLITSLCERKMYKMSVSYQFYLAHSIQRKTKKTRYSSKDESIFLCLNPVTDRMRVRVDAISLIIAFMNYSTLIQQSK